MSDANHIINQLQSAGERITLQRRLVIEALSQTGAHMTIHDVSAHIAVQDTPQPIPETTIYRILQWLKTCGIVSQTDMGETGIVYQIIGAARHHHLICLHCGRTIDVNDDLFDNLRQTLDAQYGFQARIDHMAIYGLCRDCQHPLE